MKKLVWLIAALLPLAGIAQISTKVSSAIISLDRRGDVPDAKRYIDEAKEIIDQTGGSNEKPKDLAKYYFYLGNIYYQISTSSDAEIRALEANALSIAAEALQKSIQYENSINKKYFKDQAIDLLTYAIVDISNQGQLAAEKSNLGSAHDYFMKAFKYGQTEGIGLFDTTMVYNASLMKFNEQDWDRTIELMNQLVEWNYRGIQYVATNKETGKTVAFPNKQIMEKNVAAAPDKLVDPRAEGDVRPDVIMMLANAYKQKGNQDKYLATVKLGREKFPNNERLIREELQQFLNTKQYDKAVENLKLTLETDPKNKIFHFILGSIYHTEMGKMDEAAASYDKALEIDPNYADVLYMRGLLFVSKANDLVEVMNKLGMNDTKKFDKLKAEQTEYFKQSLPYFEKARELNPEDKDVLKALREVYYKTGDTKKAMEIMEILGS